MPHSNGEATKKALGKGTPDGAVDDFGKFGEAIISDDVAWTITTDWSREPFTA